MKSHPKIIDRILEEISQYKTFCIVGHVRPDGDCVGSQLGLALAILHRPDVAATYVCAWEPLPTVLSDDLLQRDAT